MSDKWDPVFYDQKHAFVYQYGAQLIELLNPLSGERILDIGCGTGALTQKIAERGAEIIGIDQSAEMIGKAREQFSGISFEVMNAVDLQVEGLFDAVFSNATFHWIKSQALLTQGIVRVLRPGGRMVVEFGGSGNVETIIRQVRTTLRVSGYTEHASREVWYFPSISTYATLLESHGLEVTLAQLYDRPTPLTDLETGINDWLKMFGSRFFEGIDPKETAILLKDVQDKLRPVLFRKGRWWADYRRIRVVAIKKEDSNTRPPS